MNEVKLNVLAPSCHIYGVQLPASYLKNGNNN